MTTKKQAATDGVIELTLKTERLRFVVKGRSPLILNPQSAKMQRDILLPPRRKTAADKAGTLKHDPVLEFRQTITRYAGDTLIGLPTTAFKGSLMTAALEAPGMKKAQIGRLLHVIGIHAPVWGIPRLRMDGVRSADMNRTPDIRTRAELEHWCAVIEVEYLLPQLNATTVSGLLSLAGIVCGVGDFRPEKGRGTAGQFALTDDQDPEVLHLMKHAGRAAQEEAFASPEPANVETAELWGWFQEEAARRGMTATV